MTRKKSKLNLSTKILGYIVLIPVGIVWEVLTLPSRMIYNFKMIREVLNKWK